MSGVSLVAVIGFVAYDVARRIRSVILAQWTGAPARLAEVILCVGVLATVMQIVGSLGAFRLWPLVGSLVILEVAAIVIGRRWTTPMGSDAPFQEQRAGAGNSVWVAAIGSALVVSAWMPQLIHVFRRGVRDIDSMQYHLPFAARFVQSGWTTRLHYVRGDPSPTFFPENGELFHGLGMLVFHRDVMSLLVNFGWLAIALLAGWCIGRPRGAESLTMLGVALTTAIPVMAFYHAGSGLTDVAALALLLSVLALLLNGNAEPASVAVAAVAAGLALSTKLTIGPAIVAITLWLLIARSTRKKAVLLAWFVPLALSGSYWFVRNAAQAGNPFPAYRLGFGRFALATYGDTDLRAQGFSVLHYATSRTFWRHVVPRGLWDALGPAWPLILVLATLGVLLALRSARGLEKIVGVAALVTALTYVITPYSAGGPRGHPIFFVVDLRYLTPGIGPGIAALALTTAGRRAQRWLAAVLLLTSFVTVLSIGRWSKGTVPRRLAVVIGVTIAAGACVLVWRYARSESGRTLWNSTRVALLAVTLVVATVAGWYAQRSYLEHRYHPLPPPMTPSTKFLKSVDGASIAVYGLTNVYPLYGPSLRNYVEFIGVRGPHGAFRLPTSCREWWTALAAGHYDYVYIVKGQVPNASLGPDGWTRADPAARLLSDEKTVDVFALSKTSRPSAASCSST